MQPSTLSGELAPMMSENVGTPVQAGPLLCLLVVQLGANDERLGMKHAKNPSVIRTFMICKYSSNLQAPERLKFGLAQEMIACSG